MPGVTAIKDCLVPHRWLVQARKAADLSQEALAAISGVSRATIGLIERYSYRVGADMQEKIAVALRLPVTDLWPDAVSQEPSSLVSQNETCCHVSAHNNKCQ